MLAFCRCFAALLHELLQRQARLCWDAPRLWHWGWLILACLPPPAGNQVMQSVLCMHTRTSQDILLILHFTSVLTRS